MRDEVVQERPDRRTHLGQEHIIDGGTICGAIRRRGLDMGCGSVDVPVGLRHVLYHLDELRRGRRRSGWECVQGVVVEDHVVVDEIVVCEIGGPHEAQKR